MTPFRGLAIIAAIGLGGAFCYASYHKIADPPDFAKIIYNYRVVPAQLINLAAIYLPWFELLAGVALILGPCRRGAALGAAILSLIFVVALSFNLYRKHPTICGCFDTHANGVSLTREQKFDKMKSEVGLDVFFVGLAAVVFFGTKNREKDSVSA